MSVPVLTISGVIEDMDRKIDYLMCTFFFAKYSMTTYYPGEVFSLTKFLQLYGDNPIEIRSELERNLTKFMQQWFTSVQFTVKVVEDDTTPDIKLTIDGIVSDASSINSDSRSIGYSLITKDANLVRITDMLNGGGDVYSS